MQKKPYETHTLLEPKRAIRVYLDALLCEATLTATEETLLTTVDVVTDTCDDTKQTVSPEPVIETAVTTETKTPALPVKTTARLNALRSTVTAEPHIEKAHIATIENESAEPAEKNSEDDSTVYLPDWAENRFQCLSFQVAGVTLAAPLEKLHGILELTEQITELPGYAPWALGKTYTSLILPKLSCRTINKSIRCQLSSALIIWCSSMVENMGSLLTVFLKFLHLSPTMFVGAVKKADARGWQALSLIKCVLY